MFYLTTHSTHFVYGYMASDYMVKDHSDREIGQRVSTFSLTVRNRVKEGRKCFI